MSEAPNFGFQNWTNSSGSNMTPRDVQWVIDAFIKHLGQDYWNSRNEYPHPNQSVSVLNFFEGYGRLDSSGIQIVGENVGTERGIHWIAELSDNPNNAEEQSKITGYADAGVGTGMTFWSRDTSSTEAALTTSAIGTDAEAEIAVTTSAGTVRLTVGGEPGGTAPKFVRIANAPLIMSGLVADPTTVDGSFYYQTATSKYRGKIGGSFVSFITSADLPLPVTLTNLDVPYAATSATPIGPGTSDTIIAVDATAGTRTMNLPSAVTATSGFIYMVKKVDSSANTVVIDPNGAQTIEGASTFTLTKQNSVVAFVSDGSNWRFLWYYVPDSSTISTKTTAYTVQVDDKVVLCDATAGAFTVTLPPVATSAGTNVTIKKTDSSANVVTIDGNAAETIDGVLTRGLTTQYQYIVLAATSSAWFVVGFG